MTVINKWNGGLYEVLNKSGNEVELRRCSDSAILTIAKSEYTFSYRPYKKRSNVFFSF